MLGRNMLPVYSNWPLDDQWLLYSEHRRLLVAIASGVDLGIQKGGRGNLRFLHVPRALPATQIHVRDHQ